MSENKDLDIERSEESRSRVVTLDDGASAEANPGNRGADEQSTFDSADARDDVTAEHAQEVVTTSLPPSVMITEESTAASSSKASGSVSVSTNQGLAASHPPLKEDCDAIDLAIVAPQVSNSSPPELAIEEDTCMSIRQEDLGAASHLPEDPNYTAHEDRHSTAEAGSSEELPSSEEARDVTLSAVATPHSQEGLAYKELLNAKQKTNEKLHGRVDDGSSRGSGQSDKYESGPGYKDQCQSVLPRSAPNDAHGKAKEKQVHVRVDDGSPRGSARSDNYDSGPNDRQQVRVVSPLSSLSNSSQRPRYGDGSRTVIPLATAVLVPDEPVEEGDEHLVRETSEDADEAERENEIVLANLPADASARAANSKRETITSEEKRFWITVIAAALFLNTLLVVGVVVGGFCAAGACSASDSPAYTNTNSQPSEPLAPARTRLPTIRPSDSPTVSPSLISDIPSMLPTSISYETRFPLPSSSPVPVGQSPGKPSPAPSATAFPTTFKRTGTPKSKTVPTALPNYAPPTVSPRGTEKPSPTKGTLSPLAPSADYSTGVATGASGVTTGALVAIAVAAEVIIVGGLYFYYRTWKRRREGVPLNGSTLETGTQYKLRSSG
jgi:hypothetical protein